MIDGWFNKDGLVSFSNYIKYFSQLRILNIYGILIGSNNTELLYKNLKYVPNLDYFNIGSILI